MKAADPTGLHLAVHRAHGALRRADSTATYHFPRRFPLQGAN
jgi:hypothetical protein